MVAQTICSESGCKFSTQRIESCSNALVGARKSRRYVGGSLAQICASKNSADLQRHIIKANEAGVPQYNKEVYLERRNALGCSVLYRKRRWWGNNRANQRIYWKPEGGRELATGAQLDLHSTGLVWLATFPHLNGYYNNRSYASFILISTEARIYNDDLWSARNRAAVGEHTWGRNARPAIMASTVIASSLTFNRTPGRWGGLLSAWQMRWLFI